MIFATTAHVLDLSDLAECANPFDMDHEVTAACDYRQLCDAHVENFFEQAEFALLARMVAA